MPMDQWPLTLIYDLLEVEAKQMMMMTSYQDVHTETMVTTCHPGRGRRRPSPTAASCPSSYSSQVEDCPLGRDHDTHGYSW